MLEYFCLACVILSLAADIVAEEVKPVPTWADRSDAARGSDALAADRDRLITKARQVAASAIVGRHGEPRREDRPRSPPPMCPRTDSRTVQCLDAQDERCGKVTTETWNVFARHVYSWAPLRYERSGQ